MSRQVKKTSKKTPNKSLDKVYEDYNKKRVRLCEFSVTDAQAKTVAPALERLAEHYGGKVPAITAAILDADKKLSRKLKK